MSDNNNVTRHEFKSCAANVDKNSDKIDGLRESFNQHEKTCLENNAAIHSKIDKNHNEINAKLDKKFSILDKKMTYVIVFGVILIIEAGIGVSDKFFNLMKALMGL